MCEQAACERWAPLPALCSTQVPLLPRVREQGATSGDDHYPATAAGSLSLMRAQGQAQAANRTPTPRLGCRVTAESPWSAVDRNEALDHQASPQAPQELPTLPAGPMPRPLALLASATARAALRTLQLFTGICQPNTEPSLLSSVQLSGAWTLCPASRTPDFACIQP